MRFEDILYEKRDGVAKITLNRPRVGNMLRSQSHEELQGALLDAEGDDSVGVVVITGAGREAFSVGGDFRAHRNRSQSSFRQHLGKALQTSLFIRNLGKPVVAAVNGRAEGGGNQLHLVCDLTIAAEHAVFGQHGTKRGTAPFLWGIQFLPLHMGEKRAREMVLLSREYTARQAYEMGLVNRVVPYEELYAETDRWCQEILDLSPQSLRLCKVSLNFRSDLHYPAIYHGREFLGLLAGSPEFLEGVDAMAEGRKPNFRQFRRPRPSP